MAFTRRKPQLQNLNLYVELSKLHSKYPKKRPAHTDDETAHRLKRNRTGPLTSNNYIQLVADLRRGGFTADQKQMLALMHQPSWKIRKPEIMVREMGKCISYNRDEKKIAVEATEDDTIVVNEDDDDVSQYLANFRKFCKEMEEKDKERARLNSAEPFVEVEDLEDGEIWEEAPLTKNMAVCGLRADSMWSLEKDGMDALDKEILRLGTKEPEGSFHLLRS